ncbi:MAG: hypothetical protein ACOYVG_11960 [Bacteroidota bacterium]
MLSKSQEKHLLQTCFNTKSNKNIRDHISQFGVPDGDTTDETLYFITKYIKAINRLVLRNSFVTEVGLQYLKKNEQVFYLHLNMVEYLYIKHTDITVKGIYRLLKNLPALQTLIANIKKEDAALTDQWVKDFPHCELSLSL